MRVVFRDRVDAGRHLAALVAAEGGHLDAVYALPRGGVVVGAVVAQLLGVPLDVLVVRKLGHPRQPELALGAVGEGGLRVLNDELVARLGIPGTVIEELAATQGALVDERARRWRQGRVAVSMAGRSVAVVDDGIATGATARVALEMARRMGAARTVLAVPVAPRSTLERLAGLVDAVVCCEVADRFFAVGESYRDFGQVSDAHVSATLAYTEGRLEGRLTDRLAGRAGTRTVEVTVQAGGVPLPGDLALPGDGCRGLVVFAHGSGSSRKSARNRFVAERLNDRGLGTLLLDLLTDKEASDRSNVFDIVLLADRLEHAVRWIGDDDAVADAIGAREDSARIGLFGASTGAAAALAVAAAIPERVHAVVSRGGRVDLAHEAIGKVQAPVLMIVGGEDPAVLAMNREVDRELTCEHRLDVVPGAGHLFEEPGALATVGDLAGEWLQEHLGWRGSAGAGRGRR